MPLFTALSCVCIVLLLPGCSGRKEKSPYSTFRPPSFEAATDPTVIQAQIEVPAGTVRLDPQDPLSGQFHTASSSIDFLPYPGNFGYVLGCARIDTTTGKANPLPVMVLMPALSQGSVLAIRPVAVLGLRSGQTDLPVIIAIPVEPALRSVQVGNFVDLITEYDGVRTILQTWFLNYLGHQTFELAGWHDERYALSLISEWKINE